MELSNIPPNKLKLVLASLAEPHTPQYIKVDGAVHYIPPTHAVQCQKVQSPAKTDTYTPDSRVFDPVFWYRILLSPQTPQKQKDTHCAVPLALPSPIPQLFERVGVELRPYQKAFVDLVVQRYTKLLSATKPKPNSDTFRGWYLQDDAGLGKTYQSIESVLRIWELNAHHNIPPKPVLVVCPKPAKMQWKRAVVSYVKNVKCPSLWDADTFGDSHIFYVTHYEDFRSNAEEYAQTKWACVIFDEAHRLRNRKTQTYQNTKNLFVPKDPAAFYLFLSATSWHKDPDEMWGVLKIINPNIISSSKFQNLFTLFKYNGWAYQAVGCRDPLGLAQFLKNYVVSRRYAEVAPELPSMIEVPVPIEMTQAQRKAYDKIRAGTIVTFSDDDLEQPTFISNVLAAIVRRQQITSYPPLLNVQADSAKMEWLESFVDDELLDTTNQAIIFCRFRGTAEYVAYMLRQKFGADAVSLLIGGMSESQYNKQKDDFDSQKSRVCVCVFETGGTGLDFPKVKYGIAYDVHWSTIQMYQAQRRIQRLGITEQKVFYYLLCTGTVDDLIYTAFTSKWTDHSLVREYLKDQSRW